MPKFENAEEMVRWVLRNYEPAPLAEGDPLLTEIQRLERRAQLADPHVLILALRKRQSEEEEPIPSG